MKKLILSFISTLLILTGCVQNSGYSSSSPTVDTIKVNNVEKNNIDKPKNVVTVKLLKVIDGDTISVSYKGKKESVRLLLIDTPETVHPTKPVEPFGPEASKFAKDFLKNSKTVDLEFDIGQRDKYQRLLAYVWSGDKMLNQELLKNGLARVAYIYAPNTKYVDQFRLIQKDAQKKSIGIWSIENYATDEGFNQDEVTNNADNKKNIENSKSIVDANGDGKCNDVKGNIGSNGKIYHVPGGAYYEATKPEKLFCTEQEAVDAGFRKSKK